MDIKFITKSVTVTRGLPEQVERIQELEAEIERLRKAFHEVLSVQPIKGDEGSTDILCLAKALLEIDSIARTALKEKE
jgi:hypothetical protein